MHFLQPQHALSPTNIPFLFTVDVNRMWLISHSDASLQLSQVHCITHACHIASVYHFVFVLFYTRRLLGMRFRMEIILSVLFVLLHVGRSEQEERPFSYSALSMTPVALTVILSSSAS